MLAGGACLAQRQPRTRDDDRKKKGPKAEENEREIDER